MEVNLLFFKKDGSLKSVPMPSSVTVLGRRHDCDLRVRLDSVSRRHCRISNDSGALNISDLKSTNGTIVNGEKIVEKQVLPGDKVTIGKLDFVVQVDGKPESVEIENHVENKISGDDLFEEVSNLNLDDEKNN